MMHKLSRKEAGEQVVRDLLGYNSKRKDVSYVKEIIVLNETVGT